MFQHRVEKFFTEYILSDSHPIGHILDYVIKIEFQMQGSAHVHCLLWVKDSPKINEDPDEVVCQFIDNYITTQIPEPTHANEIDIKVMKQLQKTCTFGLLLTELFMLIWVSKTTIYSNTYCTTSKL